MREFEKCVRRLDEAHGEAAAKASLLGPLRPLNAMLAAAAKRGDFPSCVAHFNPLLQCLLTSWKRAHADPAPRVAGSGAARPADVAAFLAAVVDDVVAAAVAFVKAEELTGEAPEVSSGCALRSDQAQR